MKIESYDPFTITSETETFAPIQKPWTLLIRSINTNSMALEYLEFETEELASEAHKAVIRAFPNTNAVVVQTELETDDDNQD